MTGTIPPATMSPCIVGSFDRLAKATAHLSLVVLSVVRSSTRAMSASRVPIAESGRQQDSCADTADKTAQHDCRVAASKASPHPAITWGTAPSAIVTAEEPSCARRHSAAQQCFTTSGSLVCIISIKAGTTPSSTMRLTLASTDASLHNVAAQRMRVRGSGSLDSAIMAGIADAETPLSRAALPREKLKSACAQDSRIWEHSWLQRLMTAAMPP
mmetsp:Transcript_26312/g.80966  ORF Transcript_26312/g.80966 Transcript_26312/m.80966 type:complete len:214 (+) Transcript_26312:2042-2683(+)